ncbi:MAG: hypothetical protein WCR13_10820, partial [Sphaerochaeta sp.]
DVSDRNSASQTLVVGFSGSYDLSTSLKLFGQVDYINCNNYLNRSGQKASDVQLTLGATYHI